MTFSEAVTKRLLDICKERNLTINKVASLAGFDRSTLAQLTNNNVKNPGAYTLYKVATALNMTLSEFMDFPEMNEMIFEE